MNLIDKDKLTKDFEEECVGECSCCKYSIRGTGECGFIAEFPIEIEIVRCNDCRKGIPTNNGSCIVCTNHMINYFQKPDDFCSNGERRTE